MQATNERRYAHAGTAVAQRLDDDGVALDLVSGHFYRMNATSMAIWDAISDGATLASITQRLAVGHAGDGDAIEADVRAHLEELHRLGLIEQR